jgi:hypothetical protein
MGKRVLCRVLLFVCCLAAFPVSAQDPVTDFFLGGVERKINDVLDHATADGNSLIQKMAEQALAVIKAWKESNEALLKTAFDRLDTTTQNIFNEMDKTFTRLESDETIVMRDAQRLSANWIGFVKELPFTNHNPEVFIYYPRVIRPVEGGGIVPIHIIGPKLASSDPSLSDSATGTIKVDRATETELVANLDRSKLTFNDSASNLASYRLSFDSVGFSWLNPVTWFRRNPTERDLTVWLLPKFAAQYSIKQTVEDSRTEYSTFPMTLSPVGKDSGYPAGVPVPPDLLNAGWRIDFAKVLGAPFWSSPAQSGGSSCTGPDRNSLKPESFIFDMQLGHETGSFGHKTDGSVTCVLTVPILRVVKTPVPGQELKGNINWNDDAPTTLAPNILSYELNLKMFNGRSYTLTDKTKDPYEVVEIIKQPGRITFRPNPPPDF